MNPTGLRRLVSEHRSLHSSPLPPNYLFAVTASGGVPDDLTQLSILLAGPQGTPYAQGMWKVHLKMPADYPQSPPKAAFRTKIWHPNVEESTGAVCVDTLKRDWKPELTLRDVLVTISCLLIYPNPDSALNSAAGHLLQEDYDAFARQAKLMTSIHALVPKELRDAVVEAQNRGDVDPKKDVKNRIQTALPQRFLSEQPRDRQDREGSTASDDDDEDDEATASKENDPSLSPSPVSPPPISPRKSGLGNKRPLSALPTPVDPDEEEEEEGGQETTISLSERNIANNNRVKQHGDDSDGGNSNSSSGSRKSPKLSLAERVAIRGVNASGRIRNDDADEDSAALTAATGTALTTTSSSFTLYTDDGKENVTKVEAAVPNIGSIVSGSSTTGTTGTTTSTSSNKTTTTTSSKPASSKPTTNKTGGTMSSKKAVLSSSSSTTTTTSGNKKGGSGGGTGNGTGGAGKVKMGLRRL